MFSDPENGVYRVQGDLQKLAWAADQWTRSSLASPEGATSLRAEVLALQGKTEEARRLLETLNPSHRHDLTFVAALLALGDTEQALDILEADTEDQAVNIIGFTRSLRGFPSLRDHPRYQAILRKLNLTK